MNLNSTHHASALHAYRGYPAGIPAGYAQLRAGAGSTLGVGTATPQPYFSEVIHGTEGFRATSKTRSRELVRVVAVSGHWALLEAATEQGAKAGMETWRVALLTAL